MSDLSVAAVAEALQIPAGELDKFRKEGEVDVAPEVFQKKVLDHLKSHFTGTVDRTKTGSWDDGFKAAQRKTLTELERDLKSLYPGLEGKDVKELFDSAYKHGGNTDWTKDPKVQGELTNREARIKALEKELADAQTDKVRTVTTLKLESRIPDMLKDKFTIPTEAKAAQKRMKLLMDDVLQGGKIEVREVDGEMIPWNTETNKRLQNSSYQDMTLEDVILAAAADLYEPFTGSGHKAPGNGEDPPKGPAGSGDLASIQTWDQVYEYKNKISANDKDGPTKLKALADHVNKLKASGKLK